MARGHRCPLAQGWLPACRALLWPDGFRTRWTTFRNFMKLPHVFIPFRPELPGRTEIGVGPERGTQRAK